MDRSLIMSAILFAGTPTMATDESYYGEVKFKDYDAFLIVFAWRFTENDRLLAEKVKSFNKPFFFVRTHIDVDISNERRKKGFNEKKSLIKIKQNCLKYKPKDSGISTQDVFLISNRHPKKWDFNRLTRAILNDLPPRKMECLTLSLLPLTKDVLTQKIEVLKGNYAFVYRIHFRLGYVRLIARYKTEIFLGGSFLWLSSTFVFIHSSDYVNNINSSSA